MPNLPLPTKVQEKYLDRVHEFLGSSGLLMTDIKDGMGFHKARPVTRPQRTEYEMNALDAEIEERLRLAKAFVKKLKSKAEMLQGSNEIRDFQPNVTHIAYMMFADLDMLQKLSTMSDISVFDAFYCIKNCESLLARCMGPFYLLPSFAAHMMLTLSD